MGSLDAYLMHYLVQGGAALLPVLKVFDKEVGLDVNKRARSQSGDRWCRRQPFVISTCLVPARGRVSHGCTSTCAVFQKRQQPLIAPCAVRAAHACHLEVGALDASRRWSALSSSRRRKQECKRQVTRNEVHVASGKPASSMAGLAGRQSVA